MNIQATSRFLVLAAVVALPLTLSACDTIDDTDMDTAQQQQAGPPPIPEAPIEVVPMIENPQGEIWRPGYWRMQAGQFVWEPGKVIPRPSPTAIWANARWVHHAFGWSFQEGHWE